MKAKSGELRSVLSAFLCGASAPSWPAFLLTIAVAAATLWAFTTRLDEEAFLRGADRFRRCLDDDAVAATVQILLLGREEIDRPMVSLLGDAGDSGFIDVSKLQSILSAAGASARLVDLRTQGQTSWETAALLDRIPRHAQGVVVVDVAPARFQVSPEHVDALVRSPPFGFRSRALDRELQLAGRKARSLYGNFFLDNQAFLLPRLPYALWNQFFDPFKTCAAREPIRRPERESLAANLAVLERMTEKLLRQSHMNCFFVEAESAESAPWRDASLRAEYDAALGRLSQSPRIERFAKVDREPSVAPGPEERIADWLRPRDL